MMTFIITMTITFIPFIILLAILCNEVSYNYIFNREEYKVFKELNETPIENFTVTSKRYKNFAVKTHPDWSISIFDNKAAVFDYSLDERNCIACTFYKKGSTKLANKLKQLL